MKYILTIASLFCFLPGTVGAEEKQDILSKSKIQVLEGNQARYHIKVGASLTQSRKVKIEIDGYIKGLFDNVRIGFECAYKDDKAKEGDKAKDGKISYKGKDDKNNAKVISTQLTCGGTHAFNLSDSEGSLEFEISKTSVEKLWLTFSVKDDKEYKGIKSLKFKHYISELYVGTLGVSVLDDDETIVCASLIELEGNCFDVHIGVKGIFDVEGKMDTQPYYLFLARTRFNEEWEGAFEAEYYNLPKLDGEEADTETSNPFSKGSGVYKLSYTGYYDLGNKFSLLVSYGARKVPKQLLRPSEITQFYGLGIQHQSFFGAQKGRGVSGISMLKDDYWEFCKNSNPTVPAEECNENVVGDVTFHDYKERIKLFGKVALNNNGSLMLTTYMDFNRDNEGPSEAGISLTYGGKWSDLLSAF